MNSSDESKRAIRALQVLGFQFPPNKNRTQEVFKDTKYEHLLIMRRVYQEEFESFMRSMDQVLDTVVESDCHICDRKGYSYGDIPEDWGWFDAGTQWYMMCDDCQLKWYKRHGDFPEVVRDI